MMKIQHCRLLPLPSAAWRCCLHDGSWKSCFIVRCLLYLYIILQCTATDIIIRSAPQEGEVTEGDDISLDCTVRPAEFNLEISWYRQQNEQDNQVIATYNPNGGAIETLASKFIGLYESTTSFNSFILNVKNVEVSDADYKYKCGVKDKNDLIVWSSTVTLVVREMPDSKYPLCEPRDQTFNENAKKQLKCRSENLKSVTLRWYKNGKLLDSTTEDDTDELVQKYDFNVKYEDANVEFFCVQSSDSIPKLNGNCTIGPIYVNYKPRVWIEYRGNKSKSATVKHNEINVLICQANTSHANPTFTWTFSEPLNLDDYTLSPGNQYVTFTAKQQHDKLTATCIVTNNLGSGSANITIYVKNIEDHTHKQRAVTLPPSFVSEQVPPSLVVAIIGICTLFIVIIMSSVLCCLKFYAHRQFINAHMRRQEIYQRHEPSIGCTIAQPEIYFEPKDSISQSTNTSDGTSSTKRSIGIQVLPQVNLELQDIHQQQTLPARYRGRPLPQPGRPNSPVVDCGCSFV